MAKSKEMQALVDDMAKRLGWDGNPDHCRMCSGEAVEFKDALSEKEYQISGMCQECQDGFFETDFETEQEV